MLKISIIVEISQAKLFNFSNSNLLSLIEAKQCFLSSIWKNGGVNGFVGTVLGPGCAM
jgi:hypothetical protein